MRSFGTKNAQLLYFDSSEILPPLQQRCCWTQSRIWRSSWWLKYKRKKSTQTSFPPFYDTEVHPMCQSARWWCGGAKDEKQQVKEKELKVSWWRVEKVHRGDEKKWRFDYCSHLYWFKGAQTGTTWRALCHVAFCAQIRSSVKTWRSSKAAITDREATAGGHVARPLQGCQIGLIPFQSWTLVNHFMLGVQTRIQC